VRLGLAGEELDGWPARSRRAADQIDLNVDPRNIPPVHDPALPFPRRTRSFRAQGANAEAAFHF
jgi:hypothetical protein